jgi:hypothetical protein
LINNIYSISKIAPTYISTFPNPHGYQSFINSLDRQEFLLLQAV